MPGGSKSGEAPSAPLSPKTASTPPPEAPRTEPTGATPTPPPPKTSKLIKGKATASNVPSGGPQPLVLHASRAASAASEKATGLLGRITEFKREGRELGHLLPYAEKWNAADMSPVTRGMGKDRLPLPDPAGDRSSEEHFMRLRRAVKELDSAWYDSTSNLMVSPTNSLQLFSVFPCFRIFSIFFLTSCRFFSYLYEILSIFPVPEFCVESVALSTKFNLETRKTGISSPRVSG